MLKRDPSKLEARTDVCLFVGYPKGTNGYLFYDPQEQRVIVSTNAHFLEEDYMVDNKPRSRVVLDELRAKGDVSIVPETEVYPSRVASTQDQGVPYHSGRVIQQLNHFISLGEVPEEPEMDPCNYNEAI